VRTRAAVIICKHRTSARAWHVRNGISIAPSSKINNIGALLSVDDGGRSWRQIIVVTM